MADNIDVTPGTGATVRTVDRAGVETQVVILDKSGGATANVGLTGSKTLSAVTFDAVTPVLALAANAGRKAAVLANRSGGLVWLGKDNTVSATNGLPLPDGASLSDDVTVDAWWVVADAGVTGSLRVLEVA